MVDVRCGICAEEEAVVVYMLVAQIDVGECCYHFSFPVLLHVYEVGRYNVEVCCVKDEHFFKARSTHAKMPELECADIVGLAKSPQGKQWFNSEVGATHLVDCSWPGLETLESSHTFFFHAIVHRKNRWRLSCICWLLPVHQAKGKPLWINQSDHKTSTGCIFELFNGAGSRKPRSSAYTLVA